MTGTATVYIEVLDANDNSPTFDLDNFQFTIFENEPNGTFVGTVRANDLDSGTNAQVCTTWDSI